MKFLDQVRGFHRDRDTRTIINRSCAEIPRIQMTGNDNDLFRRIAAFDVTDHVCAFHVRQSLRRQNQFHFHRSLPDQAGNQIRIFRGYCTSWNPWRVIRIIC